MKTQTEKQNNQPTKKDLETGEVVKGCETKPVHLKSFIEKQKIEREIKGMKENNDWFEFFSKINNIPKSEMGELQQVIKITILKSKLLGFNLAKECVLEDAMKIVKDLDDYGMEVCRVLKKKLKEKLEELK